MSLDCVPQSIIYNKSSVIQVIHMPLSEQTMAHWKRIRHDAMTAITNNSFDDSHP